MVRLEKEERKEIVRAMPLMFVPNLKFSYKRRYVAIANAAGNLTIANALASLLVATTPILGNSLLRVVKVKRIRIWAPVVTQGTPVVIILIPVGDDASNNSYVDEQKTMTDSSQVIDRVAYVEYTPKKTHPSGSWHKSTAVSIPLVSIIAPIGSIMDVDYVGELNVSNTQFGFTQVLVGATPGDIYARAISTFQPQGVNNI